MNNAQAIKKIVKDSYSRIAKTSGNCGCKNCGCDTNLTVQKQSGQIGYSAADLTAVPEGANLGLGCGNPLAIASLKLGETVLDLGSGAGFDAFLAARKVGGTGSVIGVDMTDKMLEIARNNAKKGRFTNVIFKKGDIEALPVGDATIDVVISNCVINLAPDKAKVFQEAYRVLKPGGRLMVSDVVLLKPLPKSLKDDPELLTGCIAGALLKPDYLKLVEQAGFSAVTIHKEAPSSLEQYAVSLTYSATK